MSKTTSATIDKRIAPKTALDRGARSTRSASSDSIAEFAEMLYDHLPPDKLERVHELLQLPGSVTGVALRSAVAKLFDRERRESAPSRNRDARLIAARSDLNLAS